MTTGSRGSGVGGRGTTHGILLESPPLDVYGQMALDEALLDTGRAELTLRFFRWAPGSRPSATFGYFQRHRELPSSAQSAGEGGRRPDEGSGPLPSVRRPTGGGIVHHVDDITFSFTFEWDGTLSPQALYKNIHRGVHLGLKQRLNIKTALCLSPRSGERSAEGRVRGLGECFSRPEPMDLVASDDRKVLGGALRRRAGRVLYQGSLQLPAADPAAVEDAVARGFETEWGARFSRREAAPELLKEAAARRAQYRSDAWNHKR